LIGYLLNLLVKLEVIVLEARIDARSSETKLEHPVSYQRASTRLPTPMVTRPSLAGELARLPTAINGMQDGMAGRYEIRQRET
jgi:hypothetical protein